MVAAPDERLGEHAAAVVRLRDGAAAPTLDDVRAHLAAAGLAKPKWPESLYAVDADLPRTAVGQGPEVPPAPAACGTASPGNDVLP